MKILLVAANTATVPYPVYPLGMSVIAGALHRAGHDVEQFDFLVAEQSLAALQDQVRQFKPEAVGISIRNIDNVNLLSEQRYIDVVKDLVGTVRTAGARYVILGGSGYTLFPEQILAAAGADFGVVGEAEESLPQLLGDLQAGIFPAKPVIRSTTPLTGDGMQAALYDPILLNYYLETSNVVSVQTKRGCDRKCVYCSYPTLEGAAIRPRAPEAVVDDIEQLIETTHPELVFFTDSIFNDSAGAYLDVLRAMQRRGISIPWTAFFQPAEFSAEVLDLFKTTGLKAVELGSDAACDITLKGLNKSFSFNDVRACNDVFSAAGVSVAHYFMFGGPGETPDTVCEGIDNILSLNNSVSFMFMGIRILPGTPLEKLAVKQNIIRSDTDLLQGNYYISPEVEADWMEQKLTEAFKHVRNCIFPPDALSDHIQFLRRLGYSGLLWDMLLPKKK